MRLKACSVVFIILFMVTTGCTAFTIYKSTETLDTINGIPFYSKIGKWKQTTVLDRWWLEIEFKLVLLDKEGKDKKVLGTDIVRVTPASWTRAGHIKGTNAAKPLIPNSSLQTIISRYLDTSELHMITPNIIAAETDIRKSKSTLLAQSTESNTIELVAVVDYSKVLYYNTLVPLFSSTDASIELHQDGTLTKATSKADTTKLAELLLIPAVVEKFFGIPSPPTEKATVGRPSPPPSPPRPIRRLEITVIPAGFKYTLTKFHDVRDANGKSIPAPKNLLDFQAATSISRARIGKQPAPQRNDNAVTFTGSVNFPKKK